MSELEDLQKQITRLTHKVDKILERQDKSLINIADRLEELELITNEERNNNGK